MPRFPLLIKQYIPDAAGFCAVSTCCQSTSNEAGKTACLRLTNSSAVVSTTTEEGASNPPVSTTLIATFVFSDLHLHKAQPNHHLNRYKTHRLAVKLVLQRKLLPTIQRAAAPQVRAAQDQCRHSLQQLQCCIRWESMSCRLPSLHHESELQDETLRRLQGIMIVAYVFVADDCRLQ